MKQIINFVSIERMKALTVLLFVFAVVFVAGCYYDNETTLYPVSQNSLDTTGNGNCDTTNVTYSGTIAPLIAQRCLPACHAAATSASNGGNINLETYSSLQAYAKNGRLLGAVTHARGFVSMPNDNTTLSSCQIADFVAWVRNGSQNN